MVQVLRPKRSSEPASRDLGVCKAFDPAYCSGEPPPPARLQSRFRWSSCLAGGGPASPGLWTANLSGTYDGAFPLDSREWSCFRFSALLGCWSTLYLELSAGLQAGTLGHAVWANGWTTFSRLSSRLRGQKIAARSRRNHTCRRGESLVHWMRLISGGFRSLPP